MADSAFARCQKFLTYHPAAEWTSVVSSIASALLYVALIVLLGLFIDLIVERGEIPSYHSLPSHERQAFANSFQSAEGKGKRDELVAAIKTELKAQNFDPAALRMWDKGEPFEKLPAEEKALLWWASLPELIEDRVGEDAAQKVRDDLRHRGPDATVFNPIEQGGMLSLVVRARHSYKGRVIGFLAEWNAWTWAHGNSGLLLGLLIAAAGIALVRLLTLFLANYFGAVTVLEAITRLRRSVYHHTNRLGMLAFKTLGPTDAASISTRHLEGVHEALFQWLTVYFREPVKFGLLVAFMFVVNFWLAVAFLGIAALVWMIGGQIVAYYQEQGRNAEASSADQVVLVQESLMLTRLVKVFLMDAFNQTRLERQLGDYSDAQLRRYRGEAIDQPLFFLLGLLAAMGLLFVAGLIILWGQFGVTSCLVLAATIISLYWPLLAVLEARRVVRRGGESAEAVFDFLDRSGGIGQPIEAELVPTLSSEIRFEKVSVHEPGKDRTLLTNINLTIEVGSRVGIVGLDETEKHTLISLLPRLLDPTSGKVLFDGKDLRWVTLDSLRIQIAVILDSNLVFNDTVANNIGCGDPAFNLQRITDAAKLAHAHQFISKLPQGYETVIGELGHTLTPGEMFRIALARAI
ncbi:MAG: ABC transporter ATP-binding protein, partial [Planctomycetes bacterium]|nr:ABC transporter ATP-binding protein [Planctomycetota bacterium]